MIWWSDWKVGETNFGGQYWAQKHQNSQKSISREPLAVESWLTPQNDCKTWLTIDVLRHVYFSDNRKSPKNTIFYFLGPFIDKVAWFSISGELPIFKNGWPLKMSVVDMYMTQSTRCAQQMSFFFGLISWNFKSFHIMRTIYHIKLAYLSKWPKHQSFY